jgi:hypothetical protein
MGKAHFARAQDHAPADQRGPGGRVVRRAKRAFPYEPRSRLQPGRAPDPGHVDRLIPGEGRQDAR